MNPLDNSKIYPLTPLRDSRYSKTNGSPMSNINNQTGDLESGGIKYISLYEASKRCEYSQDYLSLRARQGKLKAVKFGRNWVTTKEWLGEYLEKISNFQSFRWVNKRQISNGVSESEYRTENYFNRNNKTRTILMTGGLSLFYFAKEFSSNLVDLGIKFGNILGKSAIRLAVSFRQLKFIPLKECFIIFLISFLFLGGLVFVRSLFANLDEPLEAFEQSDYLLRNIYRDIQEDVVFGLATEQRVGVDILKETVFGISGGYEKFASIPDAVGAKLNGLIISLFEKFNKTFQEFAKNNYQFIVQLFKKEKFVSQSVKEGLVAVPSTPKDEEFKKKIKRAFSDEVRVEPKDENSGIIVPIFREKEGENYLYILVPMREESKNK